MDAEINRAVFGVEIKCSHGIMCSDILPFSTDPESAFAIVDWMHDHGYRLMLTNNRDNVSWVAVFQHETDMTQAGSATADTPALVICRAALRAIVQARPGTGDGGES